MGKSEKDLDPMDAIIDLDDALQDGDIHLRDKYQFELKSEYTPVAEHTNTHSAEFYIFIPGALRINRHTYSKEDFYQDQTNLIRFKTPEVALSDLANSTFKHSPLNRIRALYRGDHSKLSKKVLKEMKVYANITRSGIRDRCNQIIDELKHKKNGTPGKEIERDVELLCSHTQSLRQSFLSFMEEFRPRWEGTRLLEYSRYIDEFISNTVERYFTPILAELRQPSHSDLNSAQECVKQRILWEQHHRKESEEYSPWAEDPEKAMEYAIYRQSLLRKFVWEVLFLDITRVDAARPFLQFAAAIAAGLAMLLYVYFFIAWQGSIIITDSTAFIILSVGLYVIKDRLKEGIRNGSSTLASKWFPDYKTRIHSPDQEAVIGTITEYVSFLRKKQVPDELLEVRNTRFHTELERARRIETVLYFKKQVTLYPRITWAQGTLTELNDIFRYNISRFLRKASDAYEEQMQLDGETGELKKMKAPKVYHVNILMKNIYEDSKGSMHEELRKYRLVLDKEGIKRIEKVL